MEQIKALSAIADAPITYVEIGNAIYEMKAELLSGDYNPLDVELKLKAIEEITKQLRADEDIRAFVMAEACIFTISCVFTSPGTEAISFSNSRVSTLIC